MNLLRFLAASLMSVSMVGCCCSRCVVSDPCDPCGAMPAQGGCSLSRLLPMSRNRGYSWNSACTCGACGGGIDSCCDSGSCAGGSAEPMMGGMPASNGCGCGQTAPFTQMPTMSSPTYLPSASPPNSPSGSPTLQTIPGVPPSQITEPSDPSNVPDNNSATMIPPSTTTQPQMVSYEEFQRLPGKVISGPGSFEGVRSPLASQQVAGASQPFLAPPPPSTTPTAPVVGSANRSQNRQAVWVPAKAY